MITSVRHPPVATTEREDLRREISAVGRGKKKKKKAANVKMLLWGTSYKRKKTKNNKRQVDEQLCGPGYLPGENTVSGT